MTKGSESITEFLQNVKARADELALFGSPFDNDDRTDKILETLGDDYKELVRAVQGRDTPISFEELHEKLLNFEATLNITRLQTAFPITAHVSTHTNNNWRNSNNYANQSSTNTNRSPRQPQNNNLNRQQRPYLGFCQLCRIQGHTAKKCPSYKLQPIQPTDTSKTTPWQPKTNYAATTNNSQNWLLDNGASHHVTSDLENLSLHNPYDGNDDMMIGDGTELQTTHTGSTTLTFPHKIFKLNNVLYVPSMKRNLISIHQFCNTNNAATEFLPNTFSVKDLNTGNTLLRGQTKDGVYEWPQSNPILAFSSIKTTSHDWHHRLGYPSPSILKQIIFSNKLSLTSSVSSSFNCNAFLTNKSHKLSFSQSTIKASRPLEVIYSNVWTSLVVSIDNYKYYVIFVDQYIRYIWFYPLKHKYLSSSNPLLKSNLITPSKYYILIMVVNLWL